MSPQSDSPVKERKSTLNMQSVKDFIAGGVAGAVSRTVVSPLERLKILFQVQGPEAPKFKGVIPTLRQIWVEEGWRGYLRGNGTNVIRIAPYSAVQFASYEQFKILLMEPGKSDLDTQRRLTAGALAGIASVVSTYPLDLVRTRLSLDARAYNGIIDCMIKTYRQEGGIRALYGGLYATILGIAPYVGLNFTVYETLRSYFRDRRLAQLHAQGLMHIRAEPSVTEKFACGAISGAVAQTCTYPLDVLRRRMQVVGMPTLTAFKYRGTGHAFLEIIKTEGIRGLYKGMLPNYLKVVPSISVSFVTYEYTKQLLK